jgi:hypothetical protein
MSGRVTEEELAILRTHRHPSGADLILERLRAAKSWFGAEEWVSLDALAAYSGQRAVHSRIAELRKRGYVIDHNGRAGAASAYRLVSLRDLH